MAVVVVVMDVSHTVGTDGESSKPVYLFSVSSSSSSSSSPSPTPIMIHFLQCDCPLAWRRRTYRPLNARAYTPKCYCNGRNILHVETQPSNLYRSSLPPHRYPSWWPTSTSYRRIGSSPLAHRHCLSPLHGQHRPHIRLLRTRNCPALDRPPSPSPQLPTGPAATPPDPS